MVNCASASGYAFGFSPLDIVFYLCLFVNVSRGREESTRSEKEEEERVKEEEEDPSLFSREFAVERKEERIGKEKGFAFLPLSLSLSLSLSGVSFASRLSLFLKCSSKLKLGCACRVFSLSLSRASKEEEVKSQFPRERIGPAAVIFLFRVSVLFRVTKNGTKSSFGNSWETHTKKSAIFL